MCNGILLSGHAADLRDESERLRADLAVATGQCEHVEAINGQQRDEILRLRGAIEAHRARKRGDLTPDQIDPADERLWSALDPAGEGYVLYDRGEVSFHPPA